MLINKDSSGQSFFEVDGDRGSRTLWRKGLVLAQILTEISREKKIKTPVPAQCDVEDLNQFFGKSLEIISPSRIACAAFILKYIHKNFEPGSDLNILDLGCGTGVYLQYFKNLGFFKKINYFGVDIQARPQWQELESPSHKFQQIKLPGELEIEFEPDLIFSQSALEHIINDKAVLKFLTNRFPDARHLHLVPGSVSGLNYLAHGYRRYSSPQLKKLAGALKWPYNITPLGGKYCFQSYFPFYQNELKRKHIFDFLKKDVFEYQPYRNLKRILKTDVKDYPVFYAFEIHREGGRA